jgi:DNA-binding protein
LGREKMKIDVKTSLKPNSNPQTNPPQINNLNPQSQPQNQTINNSLDQTIRLLNALLEKVSNNRQQLEHLLNQGLYPNKTSNTPNNNNDEFIVKSSMKASYIALKLEQLLIEKKKIMLSALGFAMAIAVDTTLLIKKDMSKQGREVKIDNIELFEKEVINGGRKKIISGIRISLSI